MSTMNVTNQKTEQGFAFFRMGKIKLANVAGAIKHNRRAIPAELDGKHGIDPDRVHLNYSLHGRETLENVQYAWNGFYNEATSFGLNKFRHDVVALVEIVISVSAYDRIASEPELLKAYFIDALEWLKNNFSPDLILSFDVHLDQANPHAHALIIPLVDGKMNGSAMNKPHARTRYRTQFAKEIGAKYGYQSIVERLSPMQKDDMNKAVINELTHNPNHTNLVNHALWETIRDNIRADPRPYFQSLGLELKVSTLTNKKVKSFVDHKRSKGKGSFIK
jgi:hypothetical protein